MYITLFIFFSLFSAHSLLQRISIIPLLLLLGGVSTRGVVSLGNDVRQPIVSATEVCAQLCASGLGGPPCGQSCQGLLENRNQSSENSQSPSRGSPRYDLCPTLCEQGLGMPLCKCADHKNHLDESSSTVKGRPVNYKKICALFCNKYAETLTGCLKCQRKQDGRWTGDKMATAGYNIDWETWCQTQCATGNGGSACNCDILPFTTKS